MWNVATRLLIAGWFIGMVGWVIGNGQVGEAQGGGTVKLHLPLSYHGDTSARDYVALVQGCINSSNCRGSLTGDFYTVHGDGTEWTTLVEDALPNRYSWSPDGAYFVYTTVSPDSAFEYQTWLMPLATHQPRMLLNGEYAMQWSPDSQRLALISPTALHLFEVSSDTMTAIPLPDASSGTNGNDLEWSADSQKLAWASGSYEQRAAWVWEGDGSIPNRVYEGNMPAKPLYWFPDGSGVFINGWNEADRTFALYHSKPAGDPARLLLNDHIMRGFTDDNTHIALWRDSRLYIALPDGNANYLFFDNAWVDRDNISISPGGGWVAMDSTEGLFVKSTDYRPHTHFEMCRGAVWRDDGERFACEGGWPTQYLVDVAGGVPTMVDEFPSYGNPTFLPQSDTLIGMDRYYIATSPYPHPKFEESFVVTTGIRIFKSIRSPMQDRFPVIEWRHMP